MRVITKYKTNPLELLGEKKPLKMLTNFIGHIH